MLLFFNITWTMKREKKGFWKSEQQLRIKKQTNKKKTNKQTNKQKQKNKNKKKTSKK